MPPLRIIDEELWLRVKDRQNDTRRRVAADNNGIRSERARRPKYLLSGLLQCGVCGGGYSKIADAAEAIRGLIEAVRLVPEEGELRIEIYGELAALISLGQKHKNKHPGGDTSGVQVTLVAGAGFQPATFRLCA